MPGSAVSPSTVAISRTRPYEEVVSEIEAAVRHGLEHSKLLDLKMDFYNVFSPVEIDPETDASKKMRAAATAVWGYEYFLFGGISASTDLGMVLRELQPERPQIACCGLVRAGNNLAHAADEHVFVEDLISVTKQLVHYYAF